MLEAQLWTVMHGCSVNLHFADQYDFEVLINMQVRSWAWGYGQAGNLAFRLVQPHLHLTCMLVSTKCKLFEALHN